MAPARQPLFLVSTTPGRNRSEGTARIGTNPDNPQTYAAGAILANGSRLTEIHSDHVVLRRADAELALYVSGERGTALKSRSKGSADLATMGGGASAIDKPPMVAPALGSVTDVIRSMPLYENDLLKGLQLFPGRATHVFAQLGLRSGDVVTAVNGASITDPRAAMDVLETLVNGAAVAVDVRRQNEVSTLLLDGAIVMHAISATTPPAQAMLDRPQA